LELVLFSLGICEHEASLAVHFGTPVSRRPRVGRQAVTRAGSGHEKERRRICFDHPFLSASGTNFTCLSASAPKSQMKMTKKSTVSGFGSAGAILTMKPATKRVARVWSASAGPPAMAQMTH
jgi:hypothetical protein